MCVFANKYAVGNESGVCVRRSFGRICRGAEEEEENCRENLESSKGEIVIVDGLLRSCSRDYVSYVFLLFNSIEIWKEGHVECLVNRFSSSGLK